MEGLSLFVHSVRQLTRNLGPALRISAVPLLAVAGLGYLLGAHEAWERYFIVQNTLGHAYFPWPTVVPSIVASLLVGFWVAVEWHRFVLLGETPRSVIPPVHPARIVRYGATSIAVFLLCLGTGLVGGIILGLGGGILGYIFPAISTALKVAAAVLSGLIAVIVALRLSVCLPASALGAPAGLFLGWRATRGKSVPLGIALFLVALCWVLTQVPGLILFRFSAAVAVVAFWIASSANGMLFLSLLTTAYGRYVEGRPLYNAVPPEGGRV